MSHATTRIALVLVVLATAGPAAAAPTVGFVENFPGVSVGTWGGGNTYSNPGTGGTLGNGDGFLMDVSTVSGNFGTRSEGPEYQGDWVAAGITQVRLWLNDVGNPNPFEIHFGIGHGPNVSDPNGNFWQYNIGFIPPSNAWQEFVVDLSPSANWTQTIGVGAFTAALQTVDRIHLRHDKAPFIGPPDPIAGDLGIDHILLTNGVAGVTTPGRPAIARAVELSPPAPNPSRGSVTLALETFSADAVHLQIVDAAGRLVRSAELPAGAAGMRSWAWDGRDDGGRLAAPGVYRARAWNATGGTSRPLVRIR